MACLFCPISDRTYGYFDTYQSLEKQGKDPQLKTHPTMILSDISANSLSQLEKFTVEGINNESSVAKNEWTSWPEFSWYDCGSFLLTYAENSLRCMFFLLPQGPIRVKIAILFWLWLGKKAILKVPAQLSMNASRVVVERTIMRRLTYSGRLGDASILIARFMGPTRGPSGADRTQVAPCWPQESCYLCMHQALLASVMVHYMLVNV